MSDPCKWCGAPMTHYMTHVCKGCECFYYEGRDPYEPQLGSWVELEWNPECPVHKDAMSDSASAVSGVPGVGMSANESETEMNEQTYTREDIARAWENGHSWGWDDAKTKAWAERGADIGPRADWRLRTPNPYLEGTQS